MTSSVTYNFTETFDRNALFHINKNFDIIFKNSNDQSPRDRHNILVSLRSYMKKADDNGNITISYQQKSFGKSTFGRLYPFPTTALQNIPRRIRNAIAKKYVKDYDMENAHPVILKQLCEQRGILVPLLTEYVENREGWLSSMYPDSDSPNEMRKKAKNAIISLLFGGVADKDIQFEKYHLFEAEISQIIDSLSNHKEFDKFARVAKNKNINKFYPSERGSFLSYILQDLECKILMKCITYCSDNNIRINSLIFDGFTAHNEDVIDLEALSAFIQEETSFMVKFVIKEMETDIIIPEDAEDLSFIVPYETVKLEFETHCSKIMNPIVFVDNGVILSRDQLRNKYENLQYHKLKKDVVESTSFIKEWLTDVNMRTFESIGLFPPPLVCPSNTYNIYLPYKWNAYTGIVNNDVTKFIKHLQIISNNNEEVFKYILYWIASIIQKPGIKTGVMLSFVGAEGIGKSLFVNALRRLVSDDKMMETNNPEHTIFGRFANWSDKTLGVLNDYNPAETRGCQREMLKQFITESRCVFEKKGVDSFETNNYTNFIGTTNSYNAVYKTGDSRRFLIVEVSSEMKGNYQYFKELDDYINDDSNIAGLFMYLKCLDLTGFNIRSPPNTEVGDIVAQENSNPMELFISESRKAINELIQYRIEDSTRGFIVCNKTTTGSVAVIPQRELFNRFLSWCNENSVDSKKFSSKKLQTEIFRKRNELKLEYRPNKSNSPLSMWIVKDRTFWKTGLTTNELYLDDSDSEIE